MIHIKTEAEKIYDQCQIVKEEQRKMSEWSIDKKIEYNISHLFSFFYLMRHGYSILNETISADTPHSSWKDMQPEELGDYFIFLFKRDHPDKMLGLYKEMKEWFESHDKEIFINKDIYAKYL